MITRLGTYTVQFLEEGNREEKFPSKELAMKRAREYVGNNSFAKPFRYEEKYLFGRGEGTTSVIVSQDVFDLPLSATVQRDSTKLTAILYPSGDVAVQISEGNRLVKTRILSKKLNYDD